MKKIDKLLVSSFVMPFVATFFISMFVLIMQFLWTYIDDIIGKGVGLVMISELLVYLSMSLIPTALPIATLISSVMVLGNLAEHYELSSLKSAGVPLLRVLAPLAILSVGVAGFSYFCSNNLIPVTNLKFKSRLYDIRKSKPTLSLDQGVFNEDFKGFVIHIGKKEADERTIRDVIIYNHDYKNMNRISIITAKWGEMYNSPDKQYFIMNLHDGIQYQEPKTEGGKQDDKRPFSRTYFKEWNKVFDLSEFDVQNTDEDRFRNNYSMLTTAQLREAIDSLNRKIDKRIVVMGNHLKRHFQPTKPLVVKIKKQRSADQRPPSAKRGKGGKGVEGLEGKKGGEARDKSVIVDKGRDSSKIVSMSKAEELAIAKKKKEAAAKAKKKKEAAAKAKKKKEAAAKAKKKKKAAAKAKKKKEAAAKAKKKKELTAKADSKKKKDKAKTVKQTKVPVQGTLAKPISEYALFIETLASSKRPRFINKAKSFARGIRDQAEGAITSTNHTKQIRVKHVYELNMKFSMAVVCIIFLFIGGPMGAIIRKGGFGYPILIAIFFFVIFMIMNIFCKKLAETYVLPPEWAPWIPCLILIPVGIFLTQRAMNDSKMINVERFQKIFAFIKKKVGKGEKRIEG